MRDRLNRFKKKVAQRTKNLDVVIENTPIAVGPISTVIALIKWLLI